jgi:hypothetical protein
VASPAAATEVVDGRGLTLLPGLIDAHTHTFAAPALEAALAYGATTVLDMFTGPDLLRPWREEQAAGRAGGRADIFSAGIVATAAGGHGTQYGLPIPTVDSPETAAGFVADRVAEGSGEDVRVLARPGRAEVAVRRSAAAAGPALPCRLPGATIGSCLQPHRARRGGEVGRRRERRPAGDVPRTLHTEPVAGELDLHGLTADRAEHRLEMFLDRVAVTSPGQVVRVITGRGAGSAGGPVLQGVVRDALTGWLRHRVADWAVDVGSGAYLVRLRR